MTQLNRMKFYTYNCEKTVLNLSFTCVTIYDRIFTASSNFFDKETTKYMKFADTDSCSLQNYEFLAKNTRKIQDRFCPTECTSPPLKYPQ